MISAPSVNNYFDSKPSRGFVSLYTAKTITLIASGLLGIFMPIFLYNLFGQNFQKMIIFYAAGYLLYTLALFFFVRFLNKFGFRRALRISVFLGAFYYVLFYFIDENNWSLLIPLILLVLTLYRLLYWIPYHVDFAKFTDKANRARQFSVLRATGETIGVFVPLTAGFIISRFGFDALFVMAIILFLASGIPYFIIPRTKEKYRWSYKQTFKNLLALENRKEALAFAADGAETIILGVIWPVFIFQILNGNYLQVGLVSTLIIAFTVIVELTLGKKLDLKTPKRKILKYGTLFSSLLWIIKIFVYTALQVFVVGALHNLIRIFTRIPFSTLTYEIAADEGHYVDEFTVFRELSLNITRTIVLAIVVLISLYVPLSYLFLIAAISVLFLNFLKPRIKTGMPERMPGRSVSF